MSDDVAKALNRLADAGFQQAKALQKANKINEKQLELNMAMYELQRANLAVTQLLEAELAEAAGQKAQAYRNYTGTRDN